MRKINITLFAVLLLTSALFAQIPNNGFETWVTVSGHSNPDSWGTMNNTTASSGIYTATKGTPGSPGTSYLKLTSKTVGGSVVNGIAVSGKLDSISKLPKSGFAFNGRPKSFTGKWQYMIYGNSAGFINVSLTKWNSATSQRETVGTANYILPGMVMSWATFTINFTYQNSNTPDSCIIFLKASGSNPTVNDYLWVDNLSFTYVIPTLTTTSASSITADGAIVGGNITDNGGDIISARGVCWGTTANPVVTGNHTTDGTGAGTFTSTLTGLILSTTYHVRAYATNSAGTAYGSDVTFTTVQSGYSINGELFYNNSSLTSMNSVTVNLMQGATLIATTTTDINGNFVFTSIQNGAYSLEASTSKAWGGVTATDALKIKRHISGLEFLTEPIRLTAADVNASGTINSTDVLKVQRRIANLDVSFTRPDWTIQFQGTGGNNITINSANTNVALFGICTGDVNGSYIPVNK